MKNLVALSAMVIWSAAIWAIMELIGFEGMSHDLLWGLGAAVILLIGLIGNIWIFFLIMKESPWKWLKNEDQG